ncbi:MAG: hypothetical protein IPN00_00920 [Hydrogenophilales bacterium]|jgi:hypothetical protein|nr:hypothetical protein [Hydrogenophilales bacterium]
MNPMPPRLTRFRPHAAAFALLMLASGQSFAEPATYNLMLKKGGVVLECARGAFVFDKAALAPGETSGKTSSAEVTIDAGCFSKITGRPPVSVPWPEGNLKLSGDLTIHLKPLVSKKEQPVPSVFGITGSLSSASDTIKFAYNDTEPQRTARVCDNPSCNDNSSIAVLTYHAVNVNSIPEPETLALVLLGVLGLGVARWLGRRA